ncbi:hypothetical protein EVAR_95959_1 [Eumeta japonica]|uniref:Uncharacterized protein n=1 Tax=Eumeta variegata TaxID=151549 RepID=A0A4C1VAB8_EUMVA|nr:hypothetical protein EVAR_95959_1 [Eumeta japonica]
MVRLEGIIRYELLPPDKSITSNLYCQELMRLKQEVEKAATIDQEKGASNNSELSEYLVQNNLQIRMSRSVCGAKLTASPVL